MKSRGCLSGQTAQISEAFSGSGPCHAVLDPPPAFYPLPLMPGRMEEGDQEDQNNLFVPLIANRKA